MSLIYSDFVAMCKLEPAVATDYNYVPIWRQETASDSQRYIFIQQSPSGVSDRDTRQVAMRVMVISEVNPSDPKDLWDDTEALQTYLLKSSLFNCIIGVTSIADVTSPQLLSDGRVYCELNTRVFYTIT